MEYKALLEEAYGFSLHGCRTAGAGTVLETDQGLFYLYTAPAGSKYKSRFIERVKKQLAQQQEVNMLSLVKTKEGYPHVVSDDQIYYLYRGVREGVPDDPAFAAGQALAQFHQATRSFKSDKLFLPYSTLGRWPGMWRKKLREYNGYREDMDEADGEIFPFDEYLLTSYTYVHQLGETAVQYLYHAGYDSVVKETAHCGKVAYQNFDQGYILWNEEAVRYVCGEWNWVLDMRARDIGQWIKAEVRRNGWQEDVVTRFLDGYNSVCPLLESEYAVVYGLMLYPGRFLKLVETYRALPWEERQEVDGAAWKEHLEEELIHMEEALRRYPQTIAQRYGAPVPHIDWLWRPADDKNDGVRDEASGG
jgi:spore coat protein YutH